MSQIIKIMMGLFIVTPLFLFAEKQALSQQELVNYVKDKLPSGVRMDENGKVTLNKEARKDYLKQGNQILPGVSIGENGKLVFSEGYKSRLYRRMEPNQWEQQRIQAESQLLGDTETEAKGHGVCANCSETSVTAGRDENTNIGSVQSELNLQPAGSSTPSGGSSRGKQ